MNIVTRCVIEKYYGIPYEAWPPVGSQPINYLDTIYLMNLRTPSSELVVSRIFEFIDDVGLHIYDIKDLIDVCRYIIKKNYRVATYSFDPDELGIVLRRCIVAELAGLRLLPNYRGEGVV